MNTFTHRRSFKSIVDIAVAVLAMLLVLGTYLGGMARAEPPKPALMTMDDVTAGSLLLKAKEPGKYLEAPRLASDFNITVSGPTARTIVTQRFENPSDGYVEGVYVFPLPENSAVDTLKIIEGNRVIVGEIKERQEAKQVYEKAKAKGQAAALLEQERPNMFTNSVANIGPHETVIVQIEYQESIHQSSGTYSLRLPLVVAPRYIPDKMVQTVDFSSTGYAAAAQQAKDAERISPPVLDPRQSAPVNPTTITVTLNPGFETSDVKSLYHEVTTDPASHVTRLKADAVPADKDFVLEWQAKGTAPQAGLFHEKIAGKEYVLGFVVPPLKASATADKPRETIFVIDNSGSMSGASMIQAKQSLIYGLSQLKSGDRFNVIRFDNTHDQLFPQAVAADKENIDQAKAFVDRLTADGGTEMVPAMQAALEDATPADSSSLRQVVFLTDGAISNEEQLFATISSSRGRSRIFMVGIGTAPNSYLMTRAAELGRGTFTQIGSVNDVQSKMQELYDKIGNPVMTDLKADVSGNTAKVTPDMLPDLYMGEPVQFMAEANSLSGKITLRGMMGDQPWEVTLPLDKAAPGLGISKLWARRQIADFEVAGTLGKLTPEAMQKAILAMALQHQLVSSQTSLVAVDKTPKRPANQPLTRAEVPLNLPAGWNYDKVFGEQLEHKLPNNKHHDTPETRDARAAYSQLAMLSQPAAAAPQQQVMLPQTATPAGMLAWLALLFAGLGFAIYFLPFGRNKQA